MKDGREREAYEETLEGRMRALGKAIREILMIDKLEAWLERRLFRNTK